MSKRKYENAPWNVEARKRARKQPAKELPFLPRELWEIIIAFAFSDTEPLTAIRKGQQVSHQFRDLISDTPSLRRRLLAPMQISQTTLLSLSRSGLASLDGMLFATYPASRRSTPRIHPSTSSFLAPPPQISSLYAGDDFRDDFCRGPAVVQKLGVVEIKLAKFDNLTEPRWDREFNGEDRASPFDSHNVQYVMVSWRVENRGAVHRHFLSDQYFSATVQVQHGLGRKVLCQVAKHMALAHPIGNNIYEDAQPDTTTKWQWEGYSFVAGPAYQTSAATKYMVGKPTYKVEIQPVVPR